MSVPVSEIHGMTADLAAKFKKQKLGNSEKILAAATTPKMRTALAAAMGVDAAAVLESANRADLARVKGVAGVYANLLEESGVDTIKELSKRKPENLLATMLEANQKKSLTKRPPTLAQVQDWVAQAKALPKTLTY
jgi:predicted flap endonuclease-1-like 5' DNA nuclease